MKSFFQIQIPKRSHCCQTCQALFKPSQEIISLLDVNEDDEWMRVDFCLQCKAEERGDRTLWKSRIAKKGEVTLQETTDEAERALPLLLKLVSSEQIEEQEEAFMLAIYLTRKKWLAQRKDTLKRDGRQFVLFEQLDNNDMILVPKIDPFKLSIPAIQKRLKMKLGTAE